MKISPAKYSCNTLKWHHKVIATRSNLRLRYVNLHTCIECWALLHSITHAVLVYGELVQHVDHNVMRVSGPAVVKKSCLLGLYLQPLKVSGVGPFFIIPDSGDTRKSNGDSISCVCSGVSELGTSYLPNWSTLCACVCVCVCVCVSKKSFNEGQTVSYRQ